MCETPSSRETVFPNLWFTLASTMHVYKLLQRNLKPCVYLKIGTQIIWHLVRCVTNYPNHVRHSKVRFQITYTVYSMLPSSDTFVPFEILLHAIVIAVLVGRSNQCIGYLGKSLRLHEKLNSPTWLPPEGKHYGNIYPRWARDVPLTYTCFESPGLVAKNSLCRRNFGGLGL